MQMKATLYYRNKLDENDRAIYDVLVNKWMHFENNVKIGMPHSDVSTILEAIHFDYPLLFYINYYHMSYTQSALGVQVHENYLFEKEEAKELLKFCEQWGRYIVKHKPQNIGDTEMALWLHDVILNNVSYGEGKGSRSHNIVGVIHDHLAVCEGIAMTYKFLCDLAGIPCIYIVGTLNEQAHGWNMVWINNESAFVDVTNDITTPGEFGRRNFLRSSKEMPGYSWDDSMIPECRLRNKSNEYKVAHTRQELEQILTMVGKSDSVTIHLEFGYKLSKKDIQQLIISLNFFYPQLTAYKISYSVDIQMIFVKK